ncbi:MAG: hypothetical protein ACLP0B_10195, partial [Steroidobacteraceae bacterium]
MKDRLLTFAFAVCALAAFYVFFFPKPAPADAEVSIPLSTDSGPHGYLGVWRWLKASSIPVAVLSYRYDHLDGAGLAANSTGNVLMTTMPYRLPTNLREAAPLIAWIERGNTLVVMAALDDTPDWAVTGGQSMT